MKTAKKILVICLMLIVSIMFWGAGHQVKAYTYYEMNVELGYDNQAKYGRYIPVEIEVFSQEDFTGTISVQRIASDGSTQISTYPVEISGPNSQIISAQMPLFDKNREFVFILKDSAGDEVKRKRESIEVLNSDYTELFVGVVDESGTAKKLFNQINLGEYSNTTFPYVLTKAVTLEPSQIQGDFEYTLDCIDIIVITESSMKLLSRENADCLLEWAAAGNVLIMEYTDEINQNFAEPAEEAFNKRQAQDEVFRPGLWMFGIGYESGRIGFFTSFIEDSSFLSFASTNPELIGMLLCNNCSYEMVNSIIDYDLYYAKTDESYAVQYMLNTAVGKDVPNIKRYIAVIVLYIVLAGPVLYLLLRKKNRSRFILPLVLVLACVFSYVINEMGKNTRFTDMFLQYASIIDIGDDEVNETTYMCANVPYKDTYYMKVSNDYRVMQLTELRDNTDEYNEASENEECVELVYAGEDIRLILENNVPFSRTYLETKRTHESNEAWQLDVDITYYDGVFMGSVTNTSDRDYKQLAVILHGKILMLGELKAGESIEVYDADIVTLPYYSNDAANRIVGFDRIPEGENTDNAEALYEELNGKAGIVEYVLNKYFNAKETTPVLIGFTDNREGAFQFDDRYESFGFTMVYKELDINTSIGNMTYKPLSYTDVKNLDSNSNYDAYSNTTYSSWIRLQYNFDNAKTIAKIIFDLSEGIEDDYYGTFSGVAYFYNYKTLSYDPVNISKEYFYLSELEQYLKEDGDGYTLTVQYNIKTTGQYRYTEIKLPDVAVMRRNMYVENTQP